MIVRKPIRNKLPFNPKTNITLSYVHFKKKNNVVEDNICQSEHSKQLESANNARERKPRKHTSIKALDGLCVEDYIRSLTKKQSNH